MRYIELFAGIGGFRLGLEPYGHKCVWANEWLESPRGIYKYNFGEEPDGRDIRKVPATDVPDADLIVGGFPCGTFSVAGRRTGFHLSDTRGTLCFEMFRIASERNIPYILFENVQGLLNVDDGKTFGIILSVLDELGYDCQWELLDSQNFGVAQHRERLFVIANLRGKPRPKVFPIGEIDLTDATKEPAEQGQESGLWKQGDNGIRIGTLCNRLYGGDTNNFYLEEPAVSDWRRNLVAGSRANEAVLEVYHKHRGEVRHTNHGSIPTMTASMGTGGNNVPYVDIEVKPILTPDRGEKRQNGRRIKENGEPSFTLTAQDRHGVIVGKRIRKLTPLECERLQGLPDNFTKYRLKGDTVIENADSERYERCGRAVTVPVIRAIAKKLGTEWY